MIVALFAALQAVPAPPPAETEVVVIGRKLKDWRASFSAGAKGISCVTKRSTGDAEIDAIGCTAMTECWPEAAPRFDASEAKGVKRAVRKRMLAEAEQAYGSCMGARRDALIEALAERRAAARAETGA